MSDIAIRVENLSKLYHIGRAQERHDTPSTRSFQDTLRTGLRDALTAGLRVPLERLRRKRESGSRNRGSGIGGYYLGLEGCFLRGLP